MLSIILLMDPSLRARKEAHVAGLTGTTLYEVSAVAAVPVALLLALRCAGPSHMGAWGPGAQQALAWLVFIPAQLIVQLDLISAPALIWAAGAGVWALCTFRHRPASRRRRRGPVEELR